MSVSDILVNYYSVMITLRRRTYMSYMFYILMLKKSTLIILILNFVKFGKISFVLEMSEFFVNLVGIFFRSSVCMNLVQRVVYFYANI